jgi:hypothetical protein
MCSLSVVIEFGAPLQAVAASSVLARRLELAVATEIDTALQTLGLSSGCQVQVRPGDKRPLNIRIEDCCFGPPSALVTQLWRALVSEEEIDEEYVYLAINDMIATDSAAERETVTRFLTAAAAEAAKLRPERLLRWSDVERTAGAISCEPRRVQQVMSELISLGIACGPTNKLLLEELSRLASSVDQESETIESLILTLRRQSIEVHVHRDYLEQLLKQDVEKPVQFESVTVDGAEIVQGIQDELFSNLGLRLPPIVLVAEDQLPPNCCRVRIGDLPGPLVALLPLDQVLTDKLPAELNHAGISGRLARIPASRRGASIISESDEGKARRLGHTVWTPLQYLGLVMQAEICAAAPRLVDVEAVEYEMGRLEAAFPALIEAAAVSLRLPQLTWVIRGLVRESVSVRNLRAIIERLLAFSAVLAPTRGRISVDERLLLDERLGPNAVSLPGARLQFVRIGLRHAIDAQYGRDFKLSVFRLTPRVEDMLIEHLGSLARDEEPLLSNAQLETVRDVLHRDINAHDSRVLLTTASLRLWLHDLLRDGPATIAVLAFEEVAPEWETQTIAFIDAPDHWASTASPQAAA